MHFDLLNFGEQILSTILRNGGIDPMILPIVNGAITKPLVMPDYALNKDVYLTQIPLGLKQIEAQAYIFIGECWIKSDYDNTKKECLIIHYQPSNAIGSTLHYQIIRNLSGKISGFMRFSNIKFGPMSGILTEFFKPK